MRFFYLALSGSFILNNFLKQNNNVLIINNKNNIPFFTSIRLNEIILDEVLSELVKMSIIGNQDKKDFISRCCEWFYCIELSIKDERTTLSNKAAPKTTEQFGQVIAPLDITGAECAMVSA